MMPAWGVGDDCRPSTWMPRLGQCDWVPRRERLEVGGSHLYGGALAVSIGTAVAASGGWAGRDLPWRRAHCPHPSARKMEAERGPAVCLV